MKPRSPQRAGAIAAVLQQMDASPAPAAPTADSSPPEAPASQAESAQPRQFYPAKGHARVPPEVCTPWRYADRAEWEFEHVSDVSVSIKDIGQVQPVLVRPVAADPGSKIRYEIVAGRVRWEAARLAGELLDVLIRPLDDRQAFRAMIDENERRAPLSDYSRARRFKVAITEGVYGSLTELAEALKAPKGQISKLLRLADLDSKVVAAFSSPRVLSVHLGYTLAVAIDAGFTSQIIRDARKIESGEIQVGDIPGVWAGSNMDPPSNLPGEKPEQKRPTLRHVVNDAGDHLFTVRLSDQRAPVVKLAPTVPFSEELLDDLRRLLARHARASAKRRQKGV